MRITGRGRPFTSRPSPACLPVSIFCIRASSDIAVGKESSIIDAYVAGLKAERIWGMISRAIGPDVGTPERYAQVEHDAAAGLLSLSAK